MTALNFYHENREQIVHALGSSDTVIDDIRKQHFERVMEISTRTEDEWDVDDHVVDLTAAVECLSGYIDLLLAHPDMLLGELPRSTFGIIGAEENSLHTSCNYHELFPENLAWIGRGRRRWLRRAANHVLKASIQASSIHQSRPRSRLPDKMVMYGKPRERDQSITLFSRLGP